MATALKLPPQRNFLFEVRAAQILKETQCPEDLMGVVSSKPPPGAIPILCKDIVLDRAKRPNGDCAPCPICCPRAPKYLEGALAWFPDEGVYRCIGIECIARLCGEDNAYRVRRDFDKAKSLEADYAFAFDNITLAPVMKRYLEALLAPAEHVEKLRRDLGRSQVKGDLRTHLKKNNGQLIVWQEKDVERVDARSGSTFTKRERIPLSFGLVSGTAALAENLSLSKNLRIFVNRLSVICLHDAEERILQAHDDHQSLAAVRRLLYEAKRLKEMLEEKIADVLAFFDESNFRSIQNYGNDPRSDFAVFAIVRQGEFRIGPLRSNAVSIRPNFTILNGLPEWPDLP